MVEQLRPDMLVREISVKADLPQMAFRHAPLACLCFQICLCIDLLCAAWHTCVPGSICICPKWP